MSKKIKRVTMNGVELFLKDGQWKTMTGRLVVYDTALEQTINDGLITVAHEMVRCDHWGAPGCSIHCPCYSDHEHVSIICDGGCQADYPHKCSPNAPGWAATHPIKAVEEKVDEKVAPKVEEKVEEVVEFPIEERTGNLVVYGSSTSYNIQCDVRFRGYKFADGYIGTSLWRRIGGFGNEIEHAVSVLMAKGRNDPNNQKR